MSILSEQSPALQNRTTFRKWLTEQTQTVVVKFYADWCKPCQTIKQLVHDRVLEHGSIILVEVNVDTHRDIASAYRIRGIPAMMSFRGGLPQHTVSGADIAQINQFFKKLT